MELIGGGTGTFVYDAVGREAQTWELVIVQAYSSFLDVTTNNLLGILTSDQILTTAFLMTRGSVWYVRRVPLDSGSIRYRIYSNYGDAMAGRNPVRVNGGYTGTDNVQGGFFIWCYDFRS